MFVNFKTILYWFIGFQNRQFDLNPAHYKNMHTKQYRVRFKSDSEMVRFQVWLVGLVWNFESWGLDIDFIEKWTFSLEVLFLSIFVTL